MGFFQIIGDTLGGIADMFQFRHFHQQNIVVDHRHLHTAGLGRISIIAEQSFGSGGGNQNHIIGTAQFRIVGSVIIFQYADHFQHHSFHPDIGADDLLIPQLKKFTLDIAADHTDIDRPLEFPRTEPSALRQGTGRVRQKIQIRPHQFQIQPFLPFHHPLPGITQGGNAFHIIQFR